MRTRLLTVILAGTTALAAAHPAVGIVIDRDGTVFFSDTVHVWMVRPDGSRAIAVRDVHTHELRLDADGALVGEHLVYDGGRWSHRVWRRTRDGRVHDLVPMRPGFLGDYHDVSFQQDAAGVAYWLEGTPAALRARAPGGAMRTVASFPFTNPSWLGVRPDGTAYVSEGGVVWRVRPGGSAERLPAGVSTSRERLAVMGVTEGAGRTVFVAAYFDGVVRRLSPDGRLAVVARAGEGWGPTGVAVAADGALWVLEASTTNAQRVRRVGPDGVSRVY